MQIETKARQVVGGTYVDSGVERPSIIPATGQQIGTYSDGDRDVAQAAIEAAIQRIVTSSWRDDHMLRAAALSHLADAFAARREEIIDVLTLENRKLRDEAAREGNHVLGARPRCTSFARGEQARCQRKAQRTRYLLPRRCC